MIGIDTTVIIDLFKGVKEVKEKLQKLNLPICATNLSYLELMFGLNFENAKHKQEEYYYDEFFKSIVAFDLSAEACKKASEIFHNLQKKGITIDEMDCAIAAILQKNGVHTILTRNLKHFQNIPNLKAINY